MLLLWIMVGLTIIAVGLLILNVWFLKKARSERRQVNELRQAERTANFEHYCKIYGLSAREVEVVPLIFAGHTYRSTADLLHISEKTVDSHMRSVYAKVSVRNIISLYKKLHGYS